MLRVQGLGLIAHTVNFDYEVRSSTEVFGDLPAMKIEDEMLDLARHIIKTKSGKFDLREFGNRYDKAVAELVRIEGRKIPAPKPPKDTKVTSLVDALRESAKMSGKTKPPAPSKKKAAASPGSGKSAAARQRKAG
jgi:DNA end-binding protein Ku